MFYIGLKQRILHKLKLVISCFVFGTQPQHQKRTIIGFLPTFKIHVKTQSLSEFFSLNSIFKIDSGKSQPSYFGILMYVGTIRNLK